MAEISEISDRGLADIIRAALILVNEAEDVYEDGTQPRLRACVEAFWEAYARWDPEYRPRPSEGD